MMLILSLDGWLRAFRTSLCHDIYIYLKSLDVGQFPATRDRSWEGIWRATFNFQIYAETKPLNHHIVHHSETSTILSDPSAVFVSHTHGRHEPLNCWHRRLSRPAVQMPQDDRSLVRRENSGSEKPLFHRTFLSSEPRLHALCSQGIFLIFTAGNLDVEVTL